MLELNREVRDLFRTYKHKTLKPDAVLEIIADFTLDLINAFGDELSASSPLKPDWSQFAPFEFILSINEILAKYKTSNYAGLSTEERALINDSGVLLGSLINAALTNHPDSYPDEEHFQIPNSVANELRILAEFS